MKAFAIKNKEGKYLDSCQDFETTNICDARIFDDYKEALSFSPKDCEVIEITIAGGDLEQENEALRELRKLEIEDKREFRKSYMKKIFKLEQENKELKQQLTEKDKEIEKLYKILDSQQRHIDSIEQHFRGRGTKRTGNVILDFKLQIRKQVCDEIKKVIECHSEWYEQGYVINMITEDLLKEIDKVEQAKE